MAVDVELQAWLYTATAAMRGLTLRFVFVAIGAYGLQIVYVISAAMSLWSYVIDFFSGCCTSIGFAGLAQEHVAVHDDLAQLIPRSAITTVMPALF